MYLAVCLCFALALLWLRIQLQRCQSLASVMTGILVDHYISRKTFSTVYPSVDSQMSCDIWVCEMDMHSVVTDCGRMFAFEVCHCSLPKRHISQRKSVVDLRNCLRSATANYYGTTHHIRSTAGSVIAYVSDARLVTVCGAADKLRSQK